LKGIAVYTANDPEALVFEAEAKMLLAKKLSEALKEKQKIKNREAVVYEGEDMIRRIADKSLGANAGSTIYFLGPSKFGMEANLERYWSSFHKKRIEKGIRCKILYDATSTDPQIVAERNAMPLCEARYLPLSMEMPMSFVITDDLVGMIIPTEKPPVSFLIRSEKAAEALKVYFDYLWNQSKNG
jgi:hypothetical protein